VWSQSCWHIGPYFLQMDLLICGDSQAVRLRRLVSPSAPVSQYCRGGWQTGDVKRAVRLLDHEVQRPCFLMVGINDVRARVPCQVIKGNLKTIVNIILRVAKVLLISTLPPTLNSTPSELHLIAQVNNYILSFNQRPGVVVVPLHRHFPPFSPPSRTVQLYQRRYFNGRPDNIHLSTRGLSLLLNIIAELCECLDPMCSHN